MKGVGHKLAVKYAALDVALGQYRNLVGEVQLLERLDQVKASGTVGLRNALKFPSDQERCERTIFRKLMLPPAYR